MSDSRYPFSTANPLRVLHVLEATLGGTLRYMENIAEASQGLDIISGFAYGTSRADSRLIPFLQQISKLGWSTFPVDMRREIRPWQDLRAWFQLRAAVKTFAPHIIHCHSSKAGALGRTMALSNKQRPARVYSPHALAAPLGNMYLSIEKFLSGFTEQFIAVSDTERTEMLSFSLAEEYAISVVYPSVDVTRFRPASSRVARQVLGFGAEPLVLAIGRLTAQKDPAAFLRIMELVYVKDPQAKGVWVGSGEDEEEMQHLIRSADLGEIVRIVPWQHDIRTYIAAADVVVSTSKFESFGYVTAEALAMNRPVVATDVTGTRDIMLGKLGKWLYPLGREDVAAQMVSDLLQDPINASSVGELGRSEVLQHFNTSRMRESLMQAYCSSLNQSSSAFYKKDSGRIAALHAGGQSTQKGSLTWT